MSDRVWARPAGALAAALALGACSGQVGIATQYGDDLAEATALIDRVEEAAPTAPSAMPTSGQATYTGWTGIGIETAPQETYLLGETELTADFAAGSLAGRAGNFLGRDAENRFDTYDGEILFTGGTITGNLGAVDADGTLTGNGSTITVDAEMDGFFQGNPLFGIYLASGVDFTGPLVVTVDGIEIAGEMRTGVSE
ncbi:hypothetical protein ACXN5S_05980 [Pseudoroseicyclus sp. H15]